MMTRVSWVFFAIIAGAFVAGSASAEEAKPTQAAPSAQRPSATNKKPARSRTDVAVGAALARLDDGFTMTAAPTPVTAPTEPAKAENGPRGGGLAEISVAKQGASDGAGKAREVSVSGDAIRTNKPMASVRHHRKLAVSTTLASVAPALEACRTSPAGFSVPVRIDISATGAVESAEVDGAATPLAACVSAALRGARFGAPGGQGLRLVLPVSVAAQPRSVDAAPAPLAGR